MTMIDLGDLSDLSAPRDEPPPPAFRHRRPAVAALVALLCALVLGASATPGPALVHDVWRLPADQQDNLATTGDTLYYSRATDGRTVVYAYDLATGALRWTRDLPWISGTNLASFQAADGMLLIGDMPRVALGDPPTGAMYPGGATVLDAATGEVRWRTTSEVQQTTPENVLLADRDTRGELTTLRLVSAYTGQTHWTRPVTRVFRVDVDATRVITTSEAGEVGVYRYSDGVPIARGRVAWSTGDELGTQALVHDGRFIVTRTDPLGATVTAYSLSDLSPAWSQRTLRSSLITDCGPVLCLSRGADVAGLEPATGAIRWVLSGQGVVNRVGADRLLSAGTEADDPVQMLVDAGTGRVLASLGTGWPADDLLIRRTTTAPFRTVLSRMDLTAGRAVTLGTIESTEGFYCSVAGRHLVCLRAGQIVVTAVG
ncbi:hypothetical protein GCM10010168_06150 [Actinoplanes ianthinogenes]|uniref:Pyrrolo-quinoline quinone repeat domain-containing protein n=1 Tax=Actinoplanes ianthinogenes TaxID=122358 RepID=A0ABN6CBS1_9ACTN|nr:PQQ-binding-like beta-propeller repeat protein [Actinoplanes ianthinogenes]BCJ42643.1 hypothetical protein Aiant_33000 [Actinoplanes ianthinogenes]GGQ93222.1 hypothetical protein GCM10010168_06150 [Actinoplanes ianthinogenes]